MTSSRDSESVPTPRVDPSAWESHEGFRETLLLHFTEPLANTTLRSFGGLLFEMALECAGSGRPHLTRAELRAAVADLRHLEGFLASVGQEHFLSSLDFGDTALSQLAAGQAGEVGKIADRIEAQFEEWAGSAE